MTYISEWAKQRACDLANTEFEGESNWRPEEVKHYSSLTALARHVMKYERPPVDPQIVEARKIYVELFCGGDKDYAKECLAGKYDRTPSMEALTAAVERGIEMAGKA